MKGILLTDDQQQDFDLKIKVVRDLNGLITQGLVVGDSTYQNQKILILSDKGEIKEYPMRGVGAKRHLESHKPDALAREIRTEFIADGMKVNQIQIGDLNEIQVDAYYTNGTN